MKYKIRDSTVHRLQQRASSKDSKGVPHFDPNIIRYTIKGVQPNSISELIQLYIGFFKRADSYCLATKVLLKTPNDELMDILFATHKKYPYKWLGGLIKQTVKDLKYAN